MRCNGDAARPAAREVVVWSHAGTGLTAAVCSEGGHDVGARIEDPRGGGEDRATVGAWVGALTTRGQDSNQQSRADEPAMAGRHKEARTNEGTRGKGVVEGRQFTPSF